MVVLSLCPCLVSIKRPIKDIWMVLTVVIRTNTASPTDVQVIHNIMKLTNIRKNENRLKVEIEDFSEDSSLTKNAESLVESINRDDRLKMEKKSSRDRTAQKMNE